MRAAKNYLFSIIHVTTTGEQIWDEVASTRREALEQAIAKAEENGIIVEKIIVKKKYEI